MRDIEDVDTDTAAQILGITPNAVKIRLHRARQALRTLIEQAHGRDEIGTEAGPCGGGARFGGGPRAAQACIH
jgi:hypothetical protein